MRNKTIRATFKSFKQNKKKNNNTIFTDIQSAQHKKILPISKYCTSTHQQLHMLT